MPSTWSACAPILAYIWECIPFRIAWRSASRNKGRRRLACSPRRHGTCRLPSAPVVLNVSSMLASACSGFDAHAGPCTRLKGCFPQQNNWSVPILTLTPPPPHFGRDRTIPTLRGNRNRLAQLRTPALHTLRVKREIGPTLPIVPTLPHIVILLRTQT